LAYLVYDINGNKVSGADFIIKPVGFTIPGEAVLIHDISTFRALKDGKDLAAVLVEFQRQLAQAELLVAHCMSFDENVIGAEFLRCGMKDPLPVKKKVCTLQSTIDYCALPGEHGYRWPGLSELHFKLFHSNLKRAHTADADAAAVAKCFWELKRLGIIRI
jgi:DNA polymerase III epsilon subunit-like protein